MKGEEWRRKNKGVEERGWEKKYIEEGKKTWMEKKARKPEKKI